MNTDILNSYLSQINEGLVKGIVNESGDKVKNEKNEKMVPGVDKLETNIGFNPIFNLKFSEDRDILETTTTLSQIESGKELIEKILHDNAYEQLFRYLEKNSMISNEDNVEIGKYVKTETEYLIRDLDYILSIYTDEFIDFLGDSSIENISDKGKNTLQTIKNKEIDSQKKTRRIFNIAKNVLPYSKFVVTDKFLVPLNDKFLRESLKAIRFNYSSKIKLFGEFTGDLNSNLNKEEKSDSFGEILSSLYEVYRSFFIDILGLKTDLKIVIPIALYFE